MKPIAAGLRVLLLLALLLQVPNTWAASPPLDALVQAMAGSPEPEFQLHVLRGMNAGLQGKRNLPAPAGFAELYEKLRHTENEEVRQQASLLGAIFDVPAAFQELRETVRNGTAKPEVRSAALAALVAAHDAAARPELLGLLQAPGPLRRTALRGLAEFADEEEVPRAILAAYGRLTGDERREALSTLGRRPVSAQTLLKAVEHGQVSRADLTAPFARQLQDLHDPAVEAWLQEHARPVASSSAQKQQEIARLKALLTPEAIGQGDPCRGRAFFSQTCAVCHTIFGAGAKIGPELPGAFEDVDYLLLNIVDPNAIIGKDYQQTVVQTKSGQTVIGIIGAQDASTVTLKTLGGLVVLQRAEVAELSVLNVSLMPEGLLSALSPGELADLFAYLRQHGQVPLLVNENTLNDVANDSGFERWVRSSPAAWKTEGESIVGHGSADRAEFLTSDFVANDFRFTAELRVTGVGAEARVCLGGVQAEEGFRGRYLVPGGEWVRCEVQSKGGKTQVLLDGKPVGEAPGGHTSFTFQIAGARAELQVRKVGLALVP